VTRWRRHSGALFSAAWLGLAAAQAAFAGGASGYHLVEVDSYASTFVLELRNGDGKAVEVPPTLERALIGPSPVLSFSPDSAMLIFGGPDTLRLYEPATGALRTVFTCDTLYEGSSDAIWTDDGRRLAFVQVDQELLPERTRMVVIDLGPPSAVSTFDVRIRYYVASRAGSDAGRDFWFAAPDTLEYYTWIVTNYDGDSAGLLRTIVLDEGRP
jgi:hypothetical protein